MVSACRRRARTPDLDEAGEQLEVDLAATDELDVVLGNGVVVDLAERSSGEVGAELAADLDEDLEADEDGSSACAPYLARQISCLGSRTPRVKDTPFFRFGMGCEGGWETSSAGGTPPKLEIYVQACTAKTQGVNPGSGRPEANSPTPACLD